MQKKLRIVGYFSTFVGALFLAVIHTSTEFFQSAVVYYLGEMFLWNSMDSR